LPPAESLGTDRPVKAGILVQVGEGRRDRVYCARELPEILEASSTLTLA
jgi:hypothetical protein